MDWITHLPRKEEDLSFIPGIGTYIVARMTRLKMAAPLSLGPIPSTRLKNPKIIA